MMPEIKAIAQNYYKLHGKFEVIGFRLLAFISTHVFPLPSKPHSNDTNYAVAKEK